jgi:hypothetical protein
MYRVRLKETVSFGPELSIPAGTVIVVSEGMFAKLMADGIGENIIETAMLTPEEYAAAAGKRNGGCDLKWRRFQPKNRLA